MASGLRSWTFRYRPKGSPSLKRVTLGPYPTLSLSEARERAGKLRSAVREGGNPQSDLRATIEANREDEKNRALTFDQLAALYLERYAKRHKASWRNDEGYIARHVRPEWGDRPAQSVTKQDAVRLLSDIRERTPTGANRTRSVISKLFAWAVDEGLLEMTPMLGVKKPHREGNGKDRVLTDDELRVLWSAISAGGLSKGTVAAFKVLALLGQRPGEIAGMHRSELVDLDKPGEARWEIPAERMKGRRPHVVPLPSFAREIISEQLERSDRAAGFVFASRFAEKERLARHSLSQAMRRTIHALDVREHDQATVARLKANPPTPHDLRRTLATRLAAFGIPREDRLSLLAHVYGDVHAAHYDRYERLREKRKALEAWERHLIQILANANLQGVTS
jgi:integrase